MKNNIVYIFNNLWLAMRPHPEKKKITKIIKENIFQQYLLIIFNLIFNCISFLLLMIDIHYMSQKKN